MKPLTPSQAATNLGVSKSTIRNYIRSGLLKTYRLPGGHVRITGESVEALKHTKHDAKVAAIIGKIECVK